MSADDTNARTLARFEQMIDALQVRLSVIQKRSRWEYDFVRRLVVAKRGGYLRLNGNSAHTLTKVHKKYIGTTATNATTANANS